MTAHATMYGRTSGPLAGAVDLHRTLATVPAPPDQVWRVLDRNAETITVAGQAVRTPNVVGRCLILALHAAQHGLAETKPLEDLRRGRALESDETWAAAEALAEELNSTTAFLLGLALVEEGPALNRSQAWLSADPQLRLRAIAGSRGSRSISRVRQAPWRQKLSLTVRYLFPSRALLEATDFRTSDGPYLFAVGRRLLVVSRLLPAAWREASRVRTKS